VTISLTKYNLTHDMVLSSGVFVMHLLAAEGLKSARGSAPAVGTGLDATAPDAEPAPMPSIPAAPAPPDVRTTGFEVSEDVRKEMLAGYAHAELPQINTPRRRVPALVWACAAVLLAVALAGQLLLHNREWLSAYVPALADGASSATLSAYQLQQWGVTGEQAANGTLRVRATIMNTAAQLRPYPLLRVTLADRFGRTIGRRDFEPAEYLGTPIAKLLAPGERADATLAILDPGKNAEGFEIDVCLRGVDRTISCANDAAAQSPR